MGWPPTLITHRPGTSSISTPATSPPSILHSTLSWLGDPRTSNPFKPSVSASANIIIVDVVKFLSICWIILFWLMIPLTKYARCGHHPSCMFLRVDRDNYDIRGQVGLATPLRQYLTSQWSTLSTGLSGLHRGDKSYSAGGAMQWQVGGGVVGGVAGPLVFIVAPLTCNCQ